MLKSVLNIKDTVEAKREISPMSQSQMDMQDACTVFIGQLSPLMIVAP